MSDRVIVVGAGWAGLAAAVELAAAGHPPLLLEAAPKPGGRARSLDFDGRNLDNGQHLFIGAYHQTLRLMQLVGLEADQAFLRQPMQLSLYAPGEAPVELRLSHAWPAPLNLLTALMRARGLTYRQRLSALRLALALGMKRFRLARDLPVSQLLRQYHQSPSLIHKLWAPICLATLNTPVEEASSTLFLQVLRDSFTRQRQDADLLLPRHDLGRLFPEPAVDYLREHGSQVLLGQRVRGLIVEDGRVRGVRCGEQSHRAEQVILAVAPAQAAGLLASSAGLESLAGQLTGLDSHPISTVYLRYPHDVRLPQPMIGLLDGPGQWVMERRLSGHADILSVVISGPGAHMALDKAELIRRVDQQLRQHLPELEHPVQGKVIRERRACFRALSGVQERRPAFDAGPPGLLLAGDYTAGPYPATLEGAVRSGVQCARHILRAV